MFPFVTCLATKEDGTALIRGNRRQKLIPCHINPLWYRKVVSAVTFFTDVFTEISIKHD